MQNPDIPTPSENEASQGELLQGIMSASRAVAAGTLFAHAAHNMSHRLHDCLMMSSELTRDPRNRQDKRLYSALMDLRRAIESIIQDLRSTMEMHRGGREEPELLSVNQEIPKVVEVWRIVIEGNRCTVKLALNAEHDSVVMSRSDFRELLSVLLVNAVEAHARNVTLKTENLGDTAIPGGITRRALHLVVEDNGHGIPQRDVEHLFSLSFSTKPDRPGLGLFIAGSLARKAGGELRCDSLPGGRGTAFSAILPVRGPS